MTVAVQAIQQPRPLLSPARGLAISAIVVAIASILSAVLSGRAATARFMTLGWPFVILAISVGLIVMLISVAKLHAFLALILAAISAGLMSAVGSLPETKFNHWVAAVELTGTSFGQVAGNIGIVIALASVIGMALLKSGAADTIVRYFLDTCGPKHAGLALLLATYVVSIPIFFDTVFMLLVPLALALRRSTGKDYVLYLMAICCAGCITHTMVIPHPGPAAAAQSLRIDPGLSILIGLATGLIPLACGWAACHWINRRVNVGAMSAIGAMPTRAPGDLVNSNAAGGSGGHVDGADTPLESQSASDENDPSRPSLPWALAPIVLPLALIWLASLAAMLGSRCPTILRHAAEFLGNRNVALFIGAGLSIAVLMRQRGLSLEAVGKQLGPPMETAGIIILITSAGGALGGMLKNAGIGTAIASAAAGQNINLIWLAYAVAVVMRCAQGSVTVAMITTAAILSPMMAGPLPFHPIYVFMAVGYGSMGVSWMNDSGFWVISRLGGLTEKETLSSWTVLTGVLSISGMMMTYVLSIILPLPVK